MKIKNDEFSAELNRVERFTIEEAVKLLEEMGEFDEYDPELAVERDKKAHARHRISIIKDAEGNRTFRSYRKSHDQAAVYVNIPITTDLKALEAFIHYEEKEIVGHSRRVNYFLRRRETIAGQITLFEIIDKPGEPKS